MRKYTSQFKAEVVRQYQKGVGCKEICRQFDICKSRLYDWVGEHKKALHGVVLAELQKNIDALWAEFFEIKKFLGLCKESCMGLIPKTQHISVPQNHTLRKKKITRCMLAESELKKHILQLFECSGQRFGATKITQKLREMGVAVNFAQVAKLMRELNIQSKQCGKYLLFESAQNSPKPACTEATPKPQQNKTVLVNVGGTKFCLSVQNLPVEGQCFLFGNEG